MKAFALLASGLFLASVIFVPAGLSFATNCSGNLTSGMTCTHSMERIPPSHLTQFPSFQSMWCKMGSKSNTCWAT